MRVLVVNAGSSSLKLSVVASDATVSSSALVERWSGEGDLQPLTEFLADAGGIDAVGHRVVHGGPDRAGPAPVDDALIADLRAITDLAPLHQPRAIAGLRAVRELLPDVPAAACFDTTFHATIPPRAATYALPHEWNRRWRIRRYGFHGLSHAYVARRGPELAGRAIEGTRLVSCHLGAGASLAAMQDGRSVDTSMGFTPLAGLVMATRAGSLDPGLLLWLQRHGGVTLDVLEDALEHGSGLAGLSGTSGDLRDVQAARAAGDPMAELAYDVFVHRLVREIAAMTASTGGLDLLCFTGGIGEHAPAVRRDVTARLAYLGLAIDPGKNAAAEADADISAAGGPVRTVVITAREDLEIVRQTREVLERA